MDWVSFWDAGTSVYVNEIHKRVHYKDVADGIATLVPSPGAAVLDYGAGEALSAERVKARCARLVLCDAAPTVREGLERRYGGVAGIEVAAPDELDAMPAGAFDLIVANSVVQYLDDAGLARMLTAFRHLVSADGAVVFADILPTVGGSFDDARALLVYGARNGFLLGAVTGLARTALSDYPRLRARLGLTRFEPDAFMALLARHGFAGRRITPNLGHNQSRMAFLARCSDAPSVTQAGRETPSAG